MKRLFGVMILSAVPVACGTGTPSTPDTISSAGDTQETAAASSLASRRPAPPPSCIPGDRSEIKEITVRVVEQGKSFARVRAVSVQPGEDTVPVCLAPSWSVTPTARLIPASDSEEAILYATGGPYRVTATSITDPTGARVSATRIIRFD
jgi:hypothetical protein